MPPLPAYRHTRAWIYLGVGLAVAVAGVAITLATFTKAEASGGQYLIAFGPIVAGIALAMRGISDLAGYRSFVAWRYLLVSGRKINPIGKLIIAVTLGAGVLLRQILAMQPQRFVRFAADPLDEPLVLVLCVIAFVNIASVFWFVIRYSRPAMYGFLGGLTIALGGILLGKLVATGAVPHLDEDDSLRVRQVLGFVSLGGWVIVGLCAFFGSLRAFFTFFTTVPIGGVWIGTAALVCVLSVMSGFESDLREKILGSNAHIQITREDGDFVDWRGAKDRIDRIPGVVASTPYAVSEVVLAAHNNGSSVIIKGIDPKTVGNVTDLISDLEDREAMSRLKPLEDDTPGRVIPQKAHDRSGVDPPPDDMPSGADPIDFSGEAVKPDKPTPKSGPALEPPPDLDGPPGDGPDDRVGADAVGGPVVDPPPADLVASDAAPEDFSNSGADEMPIDVIDIDSGVSKRTQSLPGVLVGRELVKQTHLYTGEEVRVVSPLSDPSNPDATGTPIPFNRDYRVAGIFYTGMYEYDLKYIYVTLDSLQDFLDRGDSVDGIEVRVGDPDDTGRFTGDDGLIAKALGPGYRVVDWKELNRSLFSALKLEKIAMFLVLGIVILVASFSIVGNLIMVVVEKAREIALLKTLGASDMGVTQLFAIQGLMIGLIGTVLGIATGLVACWAGKRFGLPLNPDVYYIDRLPIHVDPQSVAAAAAAGVLISIAATLYPALLAARVRPAAGMRH